MDKNTLSNYGWIVIAVLVLSVMIALATPFGRFIELGVKSTTEGLSDVQYSALNGTGLINLEKQRFETGANPELNPDNGEDVYNEMLYEKGEYEYRYNQHFDGDIWVTDENQNGWGVLFHGNVANPDPILESINGKPIVTMQSTFAGCSNLVNAPAIPKTVKNVTNTFSGCTSLVTAPVIPNGVTNMHSTFYGCTSLQNVSEIPNTVTIMDGTFYRCLSLESIPNISSSVTEMYFIFCDCTSLNTVPQLPYGVTNIQGAFEGCTSLTTAPAIPETVTDMAFTFTRCTGLTVAPDVSNHTSIETMHGTFSGCVSLVTATNIPCNVKDISELYSGCFNVTGTVEFPCTLTASFTNFNAEIKYYHVNDCNGICGK